MSLIPVTILTGFLGAGKTTLLKRVLTEAHGQKIAVIENEFGAENIDNDILSVSTEEQIIQMSNGCVCCTIREDLRSTLADLAAKRRRGELQFDRVVIERFCRDKLKKQSDLRSPDCRWPALAATKIQPPFVKCDSPRPPA